MVSFHYQDLEIAAQFGLGQVSLSQIRSIAVCAKGARRVSLGQVSLSQIRLGSAASY